MTEASGESSICVNIRWKAGLWERVSGFAEEHSPRITKNAAVNHLVELGLAVAENRVSDIMNRHPES